MNPVVPLIASARDRAPHFKPSRLLGLILGCALLGMISVPAVAQSVNNACWYTSGQAGTVTFNSGTNLITGNPGNNVTLQPGIAINTPLWQSNTAAVPNPPTMRCSGSAVPSGITNPIAGPPTSGNTLFPTGIPGISFELLHPDPGTLLASYPNYLITNGDGYQGTQFSVASNVELIFTGPYLPPAGTYNLTGSLGQWNVDTCTANSNGDDCRKSRGASAQPVEYFNIAVTVTVQVPTCSLVGGSAGGAAPTPNFTVALPSVVTTQFTGTGSPPSGQSPTPFNIQLTNCPSGLKVFVTLNTGSPQTGATGVIKPSGAGYAGGVGVQLLQANGTTPVTFGTAINTGIATASNYTIGMYAQYYQTGATVSAGPVQGVATYTLNYQ